MGLIEDFIARYSREYDFYEHAARLVAQKLEASLRAAGVRSIVTYRAKAASRLEEKCRKRSEKYGSLDDIYNDIVDLAGVRVALYFPAEREQVDSSIDQLFHQLEPKKIFPGTTVDGSKQKRFSGYSAAHYRVRLRESGLTESESRYAAARVEVQVASVLMHAWSEVEHDLVYKPLEGTLSSDEYAILDLLNGLVLSGEIALEQLQRAGENRVSEGGRKITNHYDLAVHLLSQAADLRDGPISDAGLGRVDLLFALIARLGIDTPNLLRPYLDSLHGDVERRALAEQIIDALLTEDSSRYEDYDAVRINAGRSELDPGREVHLFRGMFLSRWIELERLLHDVAGPVDGAESPVRLLDYLRTRDLLDPRTFKELNRMRRARNHIVHGVEQPSPPVLKQLTEELEVLIAEIKKMRPAEGEER